MFNVSSSTCVKTSDLSLRQSKWIGKINNLNSSNYFERKQILKSILFYCCSNTFASPVKNIQFKEFLKASLKLGIVLRFDLLKAQKYILGSISPSQ